MISLMNNTINNENPKREGDFKSYVAIGEYLAEHGETGIYFAIPRNIKSIAGMRKIKVEKYWDEYQEKWEREIVMEGSYF